MADTYIEDIELEGILETQGHSFKDENGEHSPILLSEIALRNGWKWSEAYEGWYQEKPLQIDNFVYDTKPNEKGEIIVSFRSNGQEFEIPMQKLDLERMLWFANQYQKNK